MGPDDLIRALLLQPDGKILIGGDFFNYNGAARDCIARLNADGSLDTSFLPVNPNTYHYFWVHPELSAESRRVSAATGR